MSRKVCVWREVKVSRAVCIVHVYFSLHRYSICRNYRHHIIYYIVYVILKIYWYIDICYIEVGLQVVPLRQDLTPSPFWPSSCLPSTPSWTSTTTSTTTRKTFSPQLSRKLTASDQNFRVSSHQQTNSFGQCIFTSRITTIIMTGIRSVHILPDYREFEKLS